MTAYTDQHQEAIQRRCAFNLLYVMLVSFISFGCMSVIIGLIYFSNLNTDTAKIYLAIGGACLATSVMIIYLYIRAWRAEQQKRQQYDLTNPVVVVMGVPILERRHSV